MDMKLIVVRLLYYNGIVW